LNIFLLSKIGILNLQGCKIDGQFNKILKPGKYFPNHCLREDIVQVNMQVTTKELKPQKVVSKDGVSIELFSILTYQIVDAYKAYCMVQDIDMTIREIIKGVTHQVLSEHELEYILAHKIDLSQDLQNRVESNCNQFGIVIIKTEIKDIKFDEKLTESLAASAIAKQIGEAKLIASRVEIDIAENLKKVGELTSLPVCQEMRYYDSVKEICKNANAKILFIPNNFSSNSEISGRVISHQINKELV
jgi:erythrocyte band 7 integral membrane protein